MRELVFLLEEPSARELLEGLIPRLIPEGWACLYLVFEAKQDLEKRMERKLRGWLKPQTIFVVLRDQDSGDCLAVKRGLVERCQRAGKPGSLARVACRDLEAWIAGGLGEFAEEFSCPQARKQRNKRRFVDPDNLVAPVDELRKLYPGYQKLDGARRMGKRLNPANNRSRSFKVFCDGLERVTRTV